MNVHRVSRKKLLSGLCLAFVLALSFANLQAGGNETIEPAAEMSRLPPPSSKRGVSFAGDIKPIFDHSCVRCHGRLRPKAHLRLDNLWCVLKGGEDGKVVKPGHSTRSLLVRSVGHVGDPDLYMPPPKNHLGIKPLSRAQVALIRAWIDQGAK
jgi:Planctomycete cytochrome C